MDSDLELATTRSSKQTGIGLRRALAIGTAAAVAMGIAGFAAGRLTAAVNERTSTAVGAEPIADTPSTSVPPTNAPQSQTTDAATDQDAAPQTTLSVAGGEVAASYNGGGGGGGQFSQNAYPEEQMQLLAERTTGDGLVLRVFLRKNGPDEMNYQFWPGADFGDWKMADWCVPSGNLRLSINSATMVNLGWGPWYTTPKDGLSVSTFAGGYVENTPAFAAAVQVAPGATSVTLTTTDGRTDTAAVVNDIAIVAVDGPIDEQFTITVERPEGAAVTSAAELTQSWSSLEYSDSCEPPPPALPEAGEQPADPVAARAAIEDSWTKVRDFGNVEQGLRITYVDDPTGIAEAWTAVQNGQYADAASTSTTAIEELVFTSPTEAWVRYNIVSSITNFPNRYGILVLGDDGVWRATRATICQDLALVPDGGCQPSAEPIYPPSAENDPRFNPRFYEEHPEAYATETTAAPAEG